MTGDTFPTWIYDDSDIPDPFGYGERAVTFLRRLKHPKSNAKGHAFQLHGWQERIVRRIYGARDENGSRIVKTVFLVLPRGNRKTSLAAALALLHVIGPEHVKGGEVLFAAADRKQARLGYQEAWNIIAEDKRLVAATRPQDFKNRILYPKAGTFLEAISADAKSQHGRTPVFALADELLHAWPKRDLFDAIRTGLAKTSGSLLVVASTAGRGTAGFEHDLMEYARDVARGKIDDPSTLPILFETDKAADWRDEKAWHRVNPGLAHGYPDLASLRQLAKEAHDKPSERAAFCQYHLNQWQDAAADPFIDSEAWNACAADFDFDDVRDLPCWLGVDLSDTTDLTAIVAAWKHGDGTLTVYPWVFCPAERIRRRAELDKVPYDIWAEQGLIETIPGGAIQPDRIEEKIKEICGEFDVREIAVDPWHARQMTANLFNAGFPAVEMRQVISIMSPAIKALERAIVDKKLRHNGHKVLAWCVGNATVRRDKVDNVMMEKVDRRKRIDAAVACAMAVGRADVAENTRSIYDDPDLDVSTLAW